MDRAGIEPLKRWLAGQALAATPAARIATHVCQALSALGFPLWRCYASTTALHPQVESVGVTWMRGGNAFEEQYEHGAFAAAAPTTPFWPAVMEAQRAARAG